MRKSLLFLALFPTITLASSLEKCDQIVFDRYFFAGTKNACSKVIKDPLFQVEIDGRQITYEYVQNQCSKLYEGDKYPIGEVSPREAQVEMNFEKYIAAEYQKYSSDYDFCDALTKPYKQILSRYLSYPSDLD